MLWERQLNNDAIESLAFTHGRPIAVVGDALVDVQDGNVLDNDVQMVDASPNGTLWYSSNTLRAEGYPATNLSLKITALSAADDLVAVALANGEVAYRTPQNPELIMLFKHRAIGADVHTATGWVVSAVLDRSAPIQLWHADHGLLQLPDPPFSANAAAVSPNGAYMSVAFEDGSIGIWSLPGLKRLQLTRLDKSATETVWRNDSAAVAFGTADGHVVVMDTEFDLLDEMDAVNGGVWSMIWKGKELFTTGSDGAVRAWAPGQTVGPIQRHAGDALSRTSIAEQKLGQPGILQTQEGIRLVDEDWESPLVGIPPGCRLHGAQMSPKKRYALLNWRPKPNREANCHASIYDIEKGEVQILPSVPEWVQSFAFHDESQLVVTGSAALGTGVRLAIWQLSGGASPSLIHDEVMQRAPIEVVTFITSKKLALGSLTGEILLHELNGTEIRSDAPVGAVRDIVLLKDGTLVSSDGDGVRWFENDLTLRGVLLDTSGAHESVWELQELASEQALQAVTQTGDRLIISLKVEDWKLAAEKKYQSH
jgi:WD40 repeat protein